MTEIKDKKKSRDDQISFKLNSEESELKRQFVSRLRLEGRMTKDAVLDMIREYLGAGEMTRSSTTVTNITSDNADSTAATFSIPLEDVPFHNMLHQILNSGVGAFVDGIKANLNSWSIAARVMRGVIAVESTNAPQEISPGVAETIARVNRLIERPDEVTEGSREATERHPQRIASRSKR